MLRINVNVSSAGAKSYYTAGDYYIDGQELPGVWAGKGAARLGLSGEIRPDDWEALCDNRDPRSGGTLTARQRDNRRVGYDFNFHAPKSVSVLHAITGDDRIREAFESAVADTMADIESEMQTRVRKSGRDTDRTTGNMVWGRFTHLTSRPVDGVPDPHLHAHCFVFNATFDETEHRWKAGQFAGVKRDAPYFEAMFHVRLARNLGDLGLEVTRHAKGWELAGIPKPVVGRFSRRTALIEAKAAEDGISDPKRKAELGAETRDRKRKDLSASELRTMWAQRMTDAERSTLTAVAGQIGGAAVADREGAAEEAMRLAAEHCTERSSVVPERELLARALRTAVGSTTVPRVLEAFRHADLVRGEHDGRRVVTTPAVLAEERDLLRIARRGRGACVPLGDAKTLAEETMLSVEQRRAIRHVVSSRDAVMLVRGAAGTGKTTMMKAAVSAIEAGGRKVHVFAPSARASRGVLRDEGFAEADTVSHLLVDSELHDAIRGQVLWIDEAGLLGTRTTAELFRLAERCEARLILAGDRRQHASVERGSALRLLEQDAGLVPAELTDIRRQRGDYKQAVKALSEGRTGDGFRILDQLGWIEELPSGSREARIASEYVRALEEGKTVLAVCPTHAEGARTVRAIRSKLRETGRLGSDERMLEVLRPVNTTEAERRDAASYLEGDVLVWHQNAPGVTRGGRTVVREGVSAPTQLASRFTVHRTATLPVAAGDVLRVTRNGKDLDGKRLDNGSLHAVAGWTAAGDLLTATGRTIPKDFPFLAHGHVITSHAAQGATVDRVLIAQSSESFGASSREQFYVSVSRARQCATVFTEDKARLREAVDRSAQRPGALEVFDAPRRTRSAIHIRMPEAAFVPAPERIPVREVEHVR